MTECEILDVLPSIRWAMLCNEYGKLERFIVCGNKTPHDEYYSCFWDALGIAADCFYCDFNEEYEVQNYYFCYESMSEYYRLCRTYCQQRRLSLKNNPYMAEAEDFVNLAMDLGSGSYGGYAFYLQTKINHRWASGLVVRTDGNYFNAELELTEAILSIGKWYAEAVVRLREDIASFAARKEKAA